MRIGVIITLFLFSVLQAFSQDDCDLKKNNEGIKVYLCENERHAFKTIIVEFEVPATLAQYAAKVLDVENYYHWQDRVRKQKIIKSISATEFYYYSQVDVPWPVADRDYIFHLKMEQDTLTKVITMSLKETPEFMPEKEGIIRVPYAESLLTLTPVDSERINVRYVLDIDPGGEVPAWLINMFAANTPYNTYHNFRQQIIEQGDKRQEVNFIQNYEKEKAVQK